MDCYGLLWNGMDGVKQVLRDSLTGRIARWLTIVPLALVLTLTVSLAAPEQARARAPQTGTATVVLSITNGTTFTYGSSTQPIFTAVVTYATKPAANYITQIAVKLETGETFGLATDPIPSPDGMTLTFSRLTPDPPAAVGQHTAIATFNNFGAGITGESNPAPFTIAKSSRGFFCGLATYASVIGVGQPVHIQMSADGGSQLLPPEFQQGSYTITFDGPAHVVIANVASDTSGIVTVTAPTHLGVYSMTCAFNGSPSYMPSSIKNPFPITFSALHALGLVQLYTNPTTLVAQQKMDFYVVFKAAPGLPTPTGEFAFWMGNYSTGSIKLGPTGDYLVHLSPVSSLSGIGHITVKYWGDRYYNEAITRPRSTSR